MKGRALLLSALLVASILAGGVSFAAPAAAGPTADAPGGMTGVPDANIQDARAEDGALSASELTVYTDNYASTTSVSIVTDEQADKVASGTPLPDVANQKVCSNPGKAAQKNPNADCDTTPSLVLSDDINHEGRMVAIDAAQLEAALGEIPGFVTVRNSETGERWQQPTRVEDGWVMIDAPHFSDNAVTWGGSVEIGQEFTDGSSVQYDISDTDSTSNVTINATGVSNTDTDTVSAASLSDGETVALGVGGTTAATNASVTFSGRETSTWDNYSAAGVSPSHTASLAVGGNLAPTDGNGGNPQLSVTGYTSLYDLGSSSQTQSQTLSEFTYGESLEIGNGGKSLYTVEDSTVYQYSLSTPWDLSTASADGSLDVSGQMADGRGVALSSDGSTLYVFDGDNDNMDEYALSTAWDVTTASHVASNSINTYGTIPQDIEIGENGDHLYVLASDTVNYYEMSTSWDTGTATRVGGYDFSTYGGGQAVEFRDDGTEMFVFGQTNQNVYKFTLSTAWDPTTGSLSQTYDVAGSDGEYADGMHFRNDGSQLFLLSNNAVSNHDTSNSVSGLSVSDGAGVSTSFGGFADGETKTKAIDLSTSSTSLDFSASGGQSIDYELTMQEHAATEDASLDVDGDGIAEASHSGTLSDGQTATYALPNLSTSDDTGTIGLATASAPVDASITYTEHTETVDPVVELNGESTQIHSGTLADGETVATEISKQQLVEGTNKLNISMGDGTLSADAPTMKTQINYQHDAEDIQTVSYDGSKFYEKYNVSKTYASDRANPTLTIPFDNNVAKIDAVEYRVNGGAWQSTDQHVLTGTEATIHLPDVTAGDTLTIRANGSRVAVSNGAISVTEPTNVGERLDTKFTVDSYNGRDDLSFALGDSLNAGQAHYIYNATWTADEYNEIDSSENHELVMPNAGTADTARISTIPIRASPNTNEVRLRVNNAQTSEPVFDVIPGASEGDGVEYTFIDAKDDTEYVLYSQSRDIVVDSGTANSPLTLTGDDSDETLQFLVDDGSATSSGGGDGGVLGPIGGGQTAGTIIDVDLGGLAWLGILGVGTLGLFGLIYWRRGRDGATEAAQTAGGGVESLLSYIASGIESTARWIGSGLISVARWLRYHPYITATLLSAGVLGLFASGALVLPAGTGVVLVVTIAVVGSYIVLRRWADASVTVWGIGALATTVVGLEALGTPVIEPLLSSQGFVVLIIAGAALAWRYYNVRQAEASTPDEVNEINFETDGGSSGGDEQ